MYLTNLSYIIGPANTLFNLMWELVWLINLLGDGIYKDDTLDDNSNLCCDFNIDGLVV